MVNLSLETRISNYRAKHPEYIAKSDKDIATILFLEGVITLAESEELKKTGVFGFGFASSEMSGLILERENKPQSNVSPKPETKKQEKSGLNRKEYSEAREFAISQLRDNVEVALNSLETYRDSFGYLSFDAADHGFRQIADWLWDGLTGRDDINTIQEKLIN